MPNEAVGKQHGGSLRGVFGGPQTLPGHAIAAYRPFYEVDFVEGSFAFSVLSFSTALTIRVT